MRLRDIQDVGESLAESLIRFVPLFSEGVNSAIREAFSNIFNITNFINSNITGTLSISNSNVTTSVTSNVSSTITLNNTGNGGSVTITSSNVTSSVTTNVTSSITANFTGSFNSSAIGSLFDNILGSVPGIKNATNSTGLIGLLGGNGTSIMNGTTGINGTITTNGTNGNNLTNTTANKNSTNTVNSTNNTNITNSANTTNKTNSTNSTNNTISINNTNTNITNSTNNAANKNTTNSANNTNITNNTNSSIGTNNTTNGTLANSKDTPPASSEVLNLINTFNTRPNISDFDQPTTNTTGTTTGKNCTYQGMKYSHPTNVFLQVDRSNNIFPGSLLQGDKLNGILQGNNPPVNVPIPNSLKNAQIKIVDHLNVNIISVSYDTDSINKALSGAISGSLNLIKDNSVFFEIGTSD